MKLLILSVIVLVAIAGAATRPNDPEEINKREWTTLTKTHNGRQLVYGCDRRHTYLDDGKCWSYCGASWVSNRVKNL